MLHRMAESYNQGNKRAKPNVQTFNSCLNACAYTTFRDEFIEAFVIAVSTFLLLEQYTKPDHVTYATFLKAISKLIPRGEERRRQVVEIVFRRCCRDGLVSRFVMEQLKFAATPDQYQDLLQVDVNIPSKSITHRDIPREWRRNLTQGR
mmetsp:Transcript_17710/g.38758  ORF Transcript_17710/g.38758 Transcript_17710/m.38758 type:complete len:149 (+) Transcript_17710:1508-1954(+)